MGGVEEGKGTYIMFRIKLILSIVCQALCDELLTMHQPHWPLPVP